MILSVLIPVYNEERTLEEVVRRVRAVEIPKEIILVDDSSQDRSREILKRLEEENRGSIDPLNQLKVFFQPFNQGKGAALKSALSHVTGDAVIIQDADLEYDPADYPELLEPIEAGLADVVYGTRFAGGGPHRVLFFWHSVGNRALTDGSGVQLSSLQAIHTIPLLMPSSCSSIAAWGKATEDGHLYQTRNLDWKLAIGAHDFPVIVIYLPTRGIAHVVPTFSGVIG